MKLVHLYYLILFAWCLSSFDNRSDGGSGEKLEKISAIALAKRGVSLALTCQFASFPLSQILSDLARSRSVGEREVCRRPKKRNQMDKLSRAIAFSPFANLLKI